MTDRRSFYEILGVDPVASQDQIKTAFRRLARERHPDRFRGAARAQAESLSSKSSQQLSNPRDLARALLAKAMGLVKGGQAAEANEYFAQSIAHDPENAKAHHLYGVFLSRQVGGLEEGLRHLDQAVRLEPNDVKILLDASKAFARARMFARASRFAQQAAQLSPGDPAIEKWMAQLASGAGGGGTG
jgi:Tfp pilus assembly protein PilF